MIIIFKVRSQREKNFLPKNSTREKKNFLPKKTFFLKKTKNKTKNLSSLKKTTNSLPKDNTTEKNKTFFQKQKQQ